MITELQREPGNLPENSFSKFLSDVGEKILGGTAAASTWRLNAVRMIHRYGMETSTRMSSSSTRAMMVLRRLRLLKARPHAHRAHRANRYATSSDSAIMPTMTMPKDAA